MAAAALEHVNVTVRDPHATARTLCTLFDWHIRWQGASALGGNTVHVGSAEQYVAVYAQDPSEASSTRAQGPGYLNHIGVVVADLEAAERRVIAAGFRTHNHADYAPGRRFYFNDADGVEYEVVTYPR